MTRPAEISDADFARDRAARRGSANPERFVVPLWEWLVREGASAYEANQVFAGPSTCEQEPGWSFQRFGCSETALPDGRVLHVAGEHEDHYDPDFFIYNDVIVRGPDGQIEIYGYGAESFPPTDFHSATLIGDRVWLIGSLGYPEDRQPGRTQVFVLELGDFSMHRVETDGEAPGWISRHSATRCSESATIRLRGGVVAGPDGFRDNVDEFDFDTTSRTWTRRTRKAFEQWSIRRSDGESFMLFEMSTLEFEDGLTHDESLMDEATKELSRQLADLGVSLDPRTRIADAGCSYDRDRYERRYIPTIAHERLGEGGVLDAMQGGTRDPVPPDDDREVLLGSDASEEFESVAMLLRVDDALVRYEDDMYDVHIKIEGRLDPAKVRILVDEAAANLAALHNCPCEVQLEFRQ